MEQDTRRAFDDLDDDSADDEDGASGVSDEDREIGRRAREIRQRRGLDQAVVAGLVGISGGQLSKLERGRRAWIRRGLIENVARELSCSVTDLTGQPYPAPDQQSALAASAIPELVVAVHDATLDDAPDLPARPVRELAAAAQRANHLADQVDYVAGGHHLAEVITHLQIHVCRGDADTRRAALPALVEACMAAHAIARDLGNDALALTITRRGYDAARAAERPDLAGLITMTRVGALIRVGARYQAAAVLTAGLDDALAAPGPTKQDTTIGQARGMLHLVGALLGARDPQYADIAMHLEEAKSLAAFTGDSAHMRYHFGPTGVAAWELAIGVETEAGPEAAERFCAAGVDLAVFESRGREAKVHFDLARSWAQAGSGRVTEAALALDRADQRAPIRMRSDPLARDLAADLRRRARRGLWELDSLCNRLGVT